MCVCMFCPVCALAKTKINGLDLWTQSYSIESFLHALSHGYLAQGLLAVAQQGLSPSSLAEFRNQFPFPPPQQRHAAHSLLLGRFAAGPGPADFPKSKRVEEASKA